MMFLESFKYDGFDTTPFIYLTRIGEPMMAPVQCDEIDFPWGGAMTTNVRPSAFDLETDILLVSEDPDRVKAELDSGTVKRQLAARLFRPYDCPLVLPNSPSFYWMAHLTGSSDFDRLSNTKSATLTWRITDPAAYGRKRKVSSKGGTVQLSVNGTYRTCPRIEVETNEEFAIFIDGIPFTVLGKPTGKAVIDRTDGTVTSGDEFLKYDVLSDIPYFEPGKHTVACSKPFKVEWTERWR